MCSDTSIISKASYVTSPAFPGGFTGTGSCMCTAKLIGASDGFIEINFEHVALSDQKVCNEEFIIFTNDKQIERVTKCSPSIIKWRQDRFLARDVTVLLRRKNTPYSQEKTVVWIGIRGKFASPRTHDTIITSFRRCFDVIITASSHVRWDRWCYQMVT